jgi:integrase
MSSFEKLKTAGMWKRGERFYTRRRVGRRVKWIALGNDFTAARKRMGEVTGGARILKRITIETATTDWLALYISTRRSEKGQKLAAQRVRDHMVAFFGGITLARIAADDVRAYRLALERKGLSQNTVSHLLSDLRTLLNWAADTGRIDKSPFPRRVMPKVEEQPPKGFTSEEIAILTSLPEPLGFEMRFLLGTGLRYGEACRAQAHDISEGTLTIGKTKSGRVRRVPLGAALLAECKQRVGRLFNHDASASTGTFNRSVARASGISDFTCHRCRHHFAMAWVAGRGSLAALQLLLGHQSIETTMRYGRVTDALVEREVKRVNEQG